MHTIKHKAKQAGYYNNEGSFRYSPFTKHRAQTGPEPSNGRQDEELGLRRARTLTNAGGSLSQLPNISAQHFQIRPAQSAQAAASNEVQQLSVNRTEQIESHPDTVFPRCAGPVDDLQSSAQIDSAAIEDQSDRQGISGQYTVMGCFRVIFQSWPLMVLLPFVPTGFAVKYTEQKPAVVFAINFIAMVPNVMLISHAVDELTIRTNNLLGSLLNMTFSNAAQLISSILLLRSKQIIVLKTSLLGSVISNLLFMLGLCFFIGGIDRFEQSFNTMLAQTISTMLFLAVLGLIVPTVSHRMVTGITEHDIVIQSRGTAIVSMLSYGLYLFFQLRTHTKMFTEPSKKAERRHTMEKMDRVVPERFRANGLTTVQEGRQSIDHGSDPDNEDDVDNPDLPLWLALSLMIAATTVLAFVADFATSSIQEMIDQSAHLSQTFVGFVILPILSNDPNAIIVAAKDKMDICLAITLEKCMQTALLVVPLLVLIDWCMSDEQMTLEFDGFSVSALFASIILVSFMIQGGRSNWLSGALLIKVYVIIALASYFVQ